MTALLAPTVGLVAVGWSGGKDSALALQALWQARVEPAALLTTVTATYGRVNVRGVRRELAAAQAAAAQFLLVEIEIPPACSNAVYEERMSAALARPPRPTARRTCRGPRARIDASDPAGGGPGIPGERDKPTDTPFTKRPALTPLPDFVKQDKSAPRINSMRPAQNPPAAP